ncbi:MAG TPA: CDP-diacylglycerol--glycerol-3-phosphate 3-phosphatidyltransferase [Caulobacteraceae bacterium]|jgi:CDP-diacylglycerol--glycerol-3-phosphate 3-phosphatidyltransferase|nr:CDP-diacylglycerol--glycerol-3-phosphate 3-phosphatidyltransferase [Caulobacteraceae bacterium]
MRALPNILTGARLVMALFVFFALATAAGDMPGLAVSGGMIFALDRWALVAFIAAAVTDFFDGWLARRLNATSAWGAILDPIADKVLVCATVLGLLALAASPVVVVPAALILFREFTVSALREALAGRVTLAVTLLAKWKTTLQLIALGLELAVAAWGALDLPPDPGPILAVSWIAHGLLWIAAIVTLITGAQYLWQARKALAAAPA